MCIRDRDHTPATLERIQTCADALAKRAQDELLEQGFARDRIHLEVYLHMRYDGTDTALMTLKPADSWNMESVFVDTYRQEFGFVLSNRAILIDDIRVRAVGRTFDSLGPSVLAEHAAQGTHYVRATALDTASQRPVYFDGEGRLPTPIVRLKDLSLIHISEPTRPY